MKAIIGFLMTLIGVSAFAADIVHTPYAAFVANCTSGSFSNGPQTDENGGIWSYGYRGASVTSGWNSFSPAKFKRASSELYGLNKQVDSNFMPYIVINPTDANVYDSGAMPNRPSGATPKNEFIVQPGTFSNGGANCGTPVIRFTAPRAGRYSVTATCEPLSQNDSDDGVTGFHLIVNGTILEERDVAHWKKGATPITYTFNHQGIFLDKGETIELATSVGIKSAKPKVNLSYACDSSSVKIEIVEDAERSVYSLGSEMATSIVSGCTDNPFGNWTINKFNRYSTDPYPDKKSLTALVWGFTRDTHFWGFSSNGDLDLSKEIPSDRSQVYFCVNTNSVGASALGATLDPNEIILIPFSESGGARSVDVRFTTPEKSTWKVTAKVRNLQASHSDSATRGVVVYGMAGGRILFRRELGASASGIVESATLTGLTSELNQGSVIDLVVDNRGGSANDPTGLKLFIEKVDGSERTFSNAGVSYAAEMAKGEAAANPFTDADGVQWEVGHMVGLSGAFSRLTYYNERVEGYLRGWLPSASSALPRVVANYNRVLIDGVSTVSSGDAVMYEDEFWVHPDKGKYGVLRYYAPSAGVYRVRASFRDINTGVASQSPQGVKCFVLANGCIAAYGNAVSTNTTKGTISLRQVSFLEPTELYLRAGEPIDLSVGIDRTAMSDATAVAATIEPDGAPVTDFVNIDFMETARTAYAGPGRIGWSNSHWNALVFGGSVGVHKSRLRNAAGTRTTVSFSISRTDGEKMTSWSNAYLPDLEKSGILSDSSSVSYAFSIEGLVPNASYRLCLYSSPSGRFTVNGGAEQQPTKSWLMGNDSNDVALLDATATAEGKITGTFASRAAGVQVPFFGLQVGGTFAEAPPSGMYILLK